MFELLAQSESTSALFSLLRNLGLFVVLPTLISVAIWSTLRIKPGNKILWTVTAWVILTFITQTLPLWNENQAIIQFFNFMVLLSAAILTLLSLLDFIFLAMLPKPQGERELPSRFALGVEEDVSIKIINHSNVPFWGTYDEANSEMRTSVLPWSGKIPKKGFNEITYPASFNHRGDKELAKPHFQYHTIIGFWTRSVNIGDVQQVKVYPNYEPVIQFALLSVEKRAEKMGIRLRNRVGMSKEFHQLRNYHYGDTLSKIDWKATSKHLSLISREYQEEKDQTIILALDCGRRMRSIDGSLSQFDHCINAMLLLAYIALKQGDHVGILSFGGQDKWLAPVKGLNSMTTILNHLYNYQSTAEHSDFTEAAQRIMTLQKRRSMVIMLSNVRLEDGDELIMPLRKIRRKHRVILGNLKEQEVIDISERKVTGFEDAIKLAASQIYLDEKDQLFTHLSKYGLSSIQATAQNFPIALTNCYLDERDSL